MHKNIHQTILGIPKTEIHLHLEGVASVDTIWKLKEKHQLTLPSIKTKEDLKKRFHVDSLNSFIDLFINVIQVCFQQEDDLYLLLDDVRDYMERNNIFYSEIFFAPTKFIQNGLDFSKILKILHLGAKKIKKESKKRIKFIIDVSRTYGLSNAERNLELTLNNLNDSIIGIGLGGAEQKGEAKEFESVFKKAQKNGLKVVAHAGEDVGPESIWQAIKNLNVERIGHGISCVEDKELLDYLKNHQIPLEVCPTSNLFTKRYATSLQDHPIRKMYDLGLYITVNTDDPTIFGKELVEEYSQLIENNIFTIDEIVQLIKNNLYATYLSTKEKDSIWNQIEKRLK